MNYRIKHLKELVRLSSIVTLTVPSVCLNSRYDPLNRFEDFRKSLKILKEDKHTKVIVKKIDDDFNEITIEAK